MNIEVEWEETGDDGDIVPSYARLTAKNPPTICGVPMHIEAYWVTETDADVQSSPFHYWREEVETFQSFCGEYLQTATINGREYVIVAFPHGA